MQQLYPLPRPVVAAAIVDSLEHPTRLLCTSRAYPSRLRGLYEFPGGKVESNENPRVALQRELEEELDVRVTLGAEVVPLADEAERDNDGFPAWPILEGRTMRVWMGQLLSDELPRPGGSHLDAIWLTFDAAQQLSWLPSNRPILTRLLAGLPA